MPQHERTDAPAYVEEMLEEGLTLFGLNQVEKAVECWRQVLAVMPDEPRAMDYLDSAGFPVDRSRSEYDGWPEGTGRRQTPLAQTSSEEASEPPLFAEPPLPAYQEPVAVTEDGITVFEVPPVSHDAWKATSRGETARELAPRRGSRIWLFGLTGGLIVVVGLLAIQFLSEEAGSGAGTRAGRSAAGLSPATSSLPATAAKTSEGTAPTTANAPAEADSYVVKLSVVPASAQIAVDGVKVARGNYIVRLARDGTRHTVEVSAPGHKPREFTFIDEAPPSNIRLPALARESSSQRARKRMARRDSERASRAPEPAERAPAGQPSEPSWAAPKSDNIDPWKSN